MKTWKMLSIIFIFQLAIPNLGCEAGEKSTPSRESKDEQTEETELTISSPAFDHGAAIPKRFTCDGEDVSPILRWGEPPVGTAVFALICHDPDAPVGDWVHWVIYDIPSNILELPEVVSDMGELDFGAKQGRNDFGRIGYGGPCPPRGKPHRYFFRIYALSAATGLESGASRDELLDAMKELILSQGMFMGHYGR